MEDLRWPDKFRDMCPHHLLARLAEEPEIGHALLALGSALVGALDGRSAETIPLYLAAKYDSKYIWRAHCQIATRHPTDPRTLGEIARIAVGAEALEGADRDLVRGVDAALDLAPTGVPAPALAVTVATYFYTLLATLLKDIEPEDGVVAVPGLETPAAARRWLNERS